MTASEWIGQQARANVKARGERPFRRLFAIPFRRGAELRTKRHLLWPNGDHAVELDCVRSVLPPGVLAKAEQRGHSVGTGADQVLIRSGDITEELYLRCLSRQTGLHVERFETLTRRNCPLTEQGLRHAAQTGMLPIQENGKVYFVLALRNFSARRICETLSRFDHVGPQIRLASHADFERFLKQAWGPTLAHAAADGLHKATPHLSAAPSQRPATPWHLYLLRISALALPLTLAPLFIVQAIGAVLAIWFLLAMTLRMAGSVATPLTPRSRVRLAEQDLPIYTVMAALYKEGRSVESLVRGLEALDYPREKLDIKLVIETDDAETRLAIAQLGPLPHVHVVMVPGFGPRTKPKALNYALTFARGTFVAIFDAEDRPDPGQLRAALDAFSAHGDDVACAQASLCIDNTSDGWLTRMFTAEYAGQFDAVLQGFSRFQMPLPLGGTSNHFRTETLREVGGWDAYNVTEDADLGFRLARFGYRAVMFSSTTYEEAPARFRAWLHQRSRWMKGWMQTWMVHMRAPLQFWREAGPSGFFTLNIVVGGGVLTALVHPIMVAEFLVEMGLQTIGIEVDTFLSSEFASLHIATIAAGYSTTAVVGLIGLARRRLLHEAWILLLTPLYWLCLSLAVWRAFFQLLRDPYRWEKTEHGLAQHSREGFKLQQPTNSA